MVEGGVHSRSCELSCMGSHLIHHTSLTSGQITRLEALPNSPENENSIDLLKSNTKGGTKQRQGTLQDYLAAMDAQSNPSECTTILTWICMVWWLQFLDGIQFPKHSSGVRLRDMRDGIYGLVLGYLKTLWAGAQEIVSDVSTDTANNAVNFMGLVTSYSHVFVKGIRYGSANHHQGKSSRYAYIHGRQSVEIQHIFQVSQPQFNSMESPLTTVCAVVQRFQQDDDIPEFPWDLRYVLVAGSTIDICWADWIQSGWLGGWCMVCKLPWTIRSCSRTRSYGESSCLLALSSRNWLLDYSSI